MRLQQIAYLACGLTLGIAIGCGGDEGEEENSNSGGSSTTSTGGTTPTGTGGTIANAGAGNTAASGAAGAQTGGTAGASTGGTTSTTGGTGGSTAERKTTPLGIGLSGIADWSTQYPFLDFMKSAREWHDWDAGQPIANVDANGWVTFLAAGAVAGTVFLTVPDDAPVPYPRLVVRWEGTGTLSYTWSAQKVDADSAPGRDVISVGTGSCLLRIESTDPADPIRNITIVPEEHVAAFDGGEIFNPDWLARMEQFRAIRFMDWMSTNGSDQTEWSDRPRPEHRTWAARPSGDGTQGVPVEIMIALANRLNADPWFNMPHLATSEYVTEFATIVRDQLAAHLIAYTEYSNEVWNFGFEQSQYAIAEAEARFGQEGGTGWVQYNGMRAAQNCDLWKGDVFSSAPERVHCVIGAFTGWRDLITDTLECPWWVEQGNTPCFEHGIDSISITGYFSGCLHADEHVDTMRSWFSDPDGGHQKGAEQALDGRHFTCDDTAAGNADTFAFFKAEADARGLVITAYEGGQHITGNAHSIQDDQEFIDFHIGINRHATMKDAYLENFTNWQEAGGTVFMHFVDFSMPSKWGSWGALEHLEQATSPKWEAIGEFNQTPCWWDGC